MAENIPTKTFDDAITRWEKRIEGLKVVRELLGHDPDFARELQELIGPSNGTEPTDTTSELGSSMFCRVLGYFRGNDNKWVKVSEIAEGAGILKGTVSYVLYENLKSGTFQKRDHPREGRVKQWRLNPDRGGD